MDSKRAFDFVGYQFDLKEGKVRPTLEHWQTLTAKRSEGRTDHSGLAGDVPHRSIDSHRKASPPRSPPFEAHIVAPYLVPQKTGDSQSLTHSRPAECGSRQAIQARPDHPNRVVSPSRGPPINMHRLHQPQIDVFATRFNNELTQFVSPVPDPLAWAVSVLSLPWEDLDPYDFPPVGILDKVVVNLQNYVSTRIILIAPGWPNMHLFWNLVAMSSQIPLCLPNLLT